MYNAHRGMAPGPQPGAIRPGERLAELLDQVRAEFEAHTQRSNENEHSCELHLLFRAQVKARPVVGVGKRGWSKSDMGRNMSRSWDCGYGTR